MWPLNICLSCFCLLMSRISCNNIFILVTMFCIRDTLFSLTVVWVLTSWDCGGLHTSDTPITSAIRTTPTTSTLTGTYRSHPCSSTLIVMRKANRMLLFYRNEFSYRFIENLTTWATREGGVYRRSGNHNGNVGRTLRHGLFRHARLSVCLEVRRMVRRLVSVFKLGFGPVNLERTVSEVSFIRNFRANHLGSDLRPGAET